MIEKELQSRVDRGVASTVAGRAASDLTRKALEEPKTNLSGSDWQATAGLTGAGELQAAFIYQCKPLLAMRA